MRKLRVLSSKLAVAALAVLLSASASAAKLARQCGAFGIVTYDSIPTPTVPAVLARQCGAFGIVTYDLPSVTETQTTPVPVPYAWLDAHVPGVAHEYDAYEAAAKATDANGHKVWESYVIGADPNDKDDMFRITAFPMKADGTPDLEAITIAPAQSKWNVEGAQPVLKGKATLDGAGEWQPVKDENKADMRFFKVEVLVP